MLCIIYKFISEIYLYIYIYEVYTNFRIGLLLFYWIFVYARPFPMSSIKSLLGKLHTLHIIFILGVILICTIFLNVKYPELYTHTYFIRREYTHTHIHHIDMSNACLIIDISMQTQTKKKIAHTHRINFHQGRKGIVNRSLYTYISIIANIVFGYSMGVDRFTYSTQLNSKRMIRNNTDILLLLQSKKYFFLLLFG